ncbi:carotenoid oxygenase family protein [Streptomyces sp. NPDC088387]|uniref:carotenoid oxygenase family protein n=1 Tax=Streptomyces sp. NPDC088387 TaxID=3365859 RepID=UPI00380A1689
MGHRHLFGISFAPPYLPCHRVTPKGLLVDSRPVEAPGPTMMHDFAITEHHIVRMDLPVVFDPLARRGGMSYRWDNGYGARLGTMSRTPGSTDVRWYDIDPRYLFHVATPMKTRRRIVLDAAFYDHDGFQRTWSDIGGPRTQWLCRRERTGPLPGSFRPAPLDHRPGHRPRRRIRAG